MGGCCNKRTDSSLTKVEKKDVSANPLSNEIPKLIEFTKKFFENSNK